MKARLITLIDWDARVASFKTKDTEVNGEFGAFHQWETVQGGGPKHDPLPGDIAGVHYDAIYYSRNEKPIDNNDLHYRLPDYDSYDPWKP